jgi:hypothetical protein
MSAKRTLMVTAANGSKEPISSILQEQHLLKVLPNLLGSSQNHSYSEKFNWLDACFFYSHR